MNYITCLKNPGENRKADSRENTRKHRKIIASCAVRNAKKIVSRFDTLSFGFSRRLVDFCLRCKLLGLHGFRQLVAVKAAIDF